MNVSPTVRTQYASGAAMGKFWKEPAWGATSKKRANESIAWVSSLALTLIYDLKRFPADSSR
jgi:hypothetical protein